MSSGSRVVPFGGADGRYVIVAFSYFANTPKKLLKIENFVAKDQRHFHIDEVVSKNRKNIC